MKKNIYDRIKKAQTDYEIAFVNFLNDGSVIEDKRYLEEHIIKNINSPERFEGIEDVFCYAAESFAIGEYKFDTMKMTLLLGLIYNASDVNEDKTIKENAKPYDNIVRFSTESVNCYLDGEKTNKYNYSGMGRQGVINYDTLLASIKKNGLDYNGPETFEELKEAILNGKKFDINLTIDLKKELPKEEVEEQPVKPKRLFRRK